MIGGMRTALVRSFAFLGGVGLIVSAVGHGLTFFVADINQSLEYFWFLHLGCLRS